MCTRRRGGAEPSPVHRARVMQWSPRQGTQPTLARGAVRGVTRHLAARRGRPRFLLFYNSLFLGVLVSQWPVRSPPDFQGHLSE
ncbi:hypothetical protein GUJ93_ZPchr0003g16601 [Zizania palustris]|uniref:Uncharacterized protein n=1 Tax=Zizania palustris TaxID=103762 RepID=A0A8J5VXQ5_ZIZPA|nr:hypothetical protein GUJ93_ZPchr0003g16601 [Zizania palustris]